MLFCNSEGLPITEHLPEGHEGREIYLVYGTRYIEDMYYQEEFERTAHEFPNFHYVMTLSRPPESWKGEKGYVQDKVRELLMKRQSDQRSNLDAYICGLNDMVSANASMPNGMLM